MRENATLSDTWQHTQTKTAPRNRQAPRGCCYVWGLLLADRCLGAIKEKLDHPADGLVGDRPAVRETLKEPEKKKHQNTKTAL